METEDVVVGTTTVSTEGASSSRVNGCSSLENDGDVNIIVPSSSSVGNDDDEIPAPSCSTTKGKSKAIKNTSKRKCRVVLADDSDDE